MTELSSRIRSFALKVSADAASPNDDPTDLLNQVRPLLMKMDLYNSVDKTKDVRLEEGQLKENRLYHLVLKRNTVITQDKISRIKRNEDFFSQIVWTNKAMELYVWYPYEAKEVPATQAAPALAPI